MWSRKWFYSPGYSPRRILLAFTEALFFIISNLSCGARKNRNIRNNTFVLNAVLNEVNKNKKKAVEILIYDYRQCFDGLDVETTVNDLYEAGVTSDHLNLINECDKSSNIAIKTPVGITKRSEVKKCVAQGECLSPLKCTCTIDNIADKHIENLSEHPYLYKDSVPLPPLGMVDDQLCIANCGLDSVLANIGKYGTHHS